MKLLYVRGSLQYLICSPSFQLFTFEETRLLLEEVYNQKLTVLVIMSREEIDRILRSDLSEFDHSIDNKISSIEEITGKLSEKSNFLTQFQLLLQQEMTKFKALPPEEAPKEAASQATEAVPRISEYSADKQLDDGVQPAGKAQQISVSDDHVDGSIEYANFRSFASPPPNQMQRYQSGKILRHFNAVRSQLYQFKLLVALLKEEMKAEIHYFKELVLRDIENSFYQVLSKERQKYEEEIRNLTNQIVALRQAGRRSEQINPFTDLTFTKLSEQNSLSVTQKLKQYQPSQKLPRTPTPKDLPSGEASSEEWKGYRLDFNQNMQLPAKFRPMQRQRESFAVPETKTLAVGVPPIKTGFGVLRIGNKTIYKGMWRDGKFDGSGKLSWEDYCYEGMFSAGCFEGHGRLQFKEMTYVGKFEGNKASGEGTLEVAGRKIMGVWDKNTLIRIF